MMVTKNENAPLNRSYGLKDVTRDSYFSTSIKDLILESNRRENVITKIEKRFYALKKKNNDEDKHELNVLAEVLYKLSRKKDEINTKIIILQYQQQTDSYQKLAQAENLYSEKNEQVNVLEEHTDKVFKTLIVVDRNLKKRIKNNKPKGDKNIEKFEYLTTIAIQITNDYAEKYPEKLNENECEFRVTAKIKNAFLDHFEDEEEQKIANIKGLPDKNTVSANITKAFRALGFPSYSEAKKRNNPKT